MSHGGGKDPTIFQSKPFTVTDPVTGKQFTQETNPYLLNAGIRAPGITSTDATADLNNFITQRKAQEVTDSQTKAAQDAADKQTKQDTFNTSRQSAFDAALNSVIHTFANQGVDPNTFLESDIKPALLQTMNSIPNLDPNPGSAFPSSLGATILGNVVNDRRTNALNQLNSVFTPTYTDTLLPESTENSFIDQILGSQFDPLSTQLSNLQKRGTLNETGFKAATDLLNTKRNAARDTVTNLGHGILTSERGDINDIIKGARDDVSNLTLKGAETFDPNVYASKAKGIADTDIANFGGALTAKVGDSKFATLQELLNAGGALQGGTNPNAANPNALPGLAPADNDPLRNQPRGLGNTGAF